MNVYEQRSALAAYFGLDAGPYQKPMSLESPVEFRIVKLQPAYSPFATDQLAIGGWRGANVTFPRRFGHYKPPSVVLTAVKARSIGAHYSYRRAGQPACLAHVQRSIALRRRQLRLSGPLLGNSAIEHLAAVWLKRFAMGDARVLKKSAPLALKIGRSWLCADLIGSSPEGSANDAI